MRTFLALVVSTLFAAVANAQLPKIWVQPFTSANDQQQTDWMSRAINRSLNDELASVRLIELVQGQTRPADVQYVVTGQIQRNSGQIRVTGQVTDARDNRPAGGFKATGSDRELFTIEDSLASQIKAIVAPQAAIASAPPTTMPTQLQAPFAPIRYGSFEGSDLQRALENNQPLAPPTTVYVPPVYFPPTYPTYPVTYGLGGIYPPYSYLGGYGGYWSWPGSSIIVVNNRKSHREDHHRGHVFVPGPSVPTDNGQRIRQESSFAGRTPPPGIITTVTRAPSLVATPPSLIATPPSMVARQPSNVANGPSLVAGNARR